MDKTGTADDGNHEEYGKNCPTVSNLGDSDLAEKLIDSRNSHFYLTCSRSKALTVKKLSFTFSSYLRFLIS